MPATIFLRLCLCLHDCTKLYGHRTTDPHRTKYS